MTSVPLLPQLVSVAAGIRRVAERYQSVIIGLAAIVFGGFFVWSVSRLGLQWETIGWRWLAAAAATIPLAMIANASELALCARAVGRTMPIRSAFIYSAGATLLNILPLPGGMVLRAKALADQGAGWIASSAVIAAAGLLWLSMAIACVGLALLPASAGLLALAGGLVGSALVAGWIVRHAGIGVAVGFTLVRAALVGLLVVRLSFCFHAIRQPVDLQESAIFVVAGVVANGVAIVPSGLGIAEGIGAAMAGLIGASAAAAFLAIAVSRLLGLGGSLIVVILHLPGSRRATAGYPASAEAS